MRIPVTIAAIVALAASGAAEARAHHFSFSWAAHVSDLQAQAGAEAFVKDELPAGIAMSDAVQRTQAAGARCRPASREVGGVACRYFITSNSDQGALGEDVWTVSLVPDGAGKLASAAIARSRVGLRGDLPDEPTYRW
jgi:hypothetical protein